MDWNKIIGFVGVPSTIALYLVWQFSANIQSDIRSIKEHMNVHTTMTQSQMAVMENQSKVNVELMKNLTKICINTAKTAVERGNCFKD